MNKELDKRFLFKETEENLILNWKNDNVFKFKNSQKEKPFCIMMPPPNITGSLHMGHALTFTLQDILVRYYKKLGKNVLWQPGTDHAGIATEIIVEKKLNDEQSLSKKSIGRDIFLQKIWEWKNISGNKIIEQLNKLGTAVDWSISRFTLDEGLSESVKKVFIDLFNSGLIYQDKRLVNWDPILETAVSDLEVNQKEINGKLWYINYKIQNCENHLTIATTRPETLFGDTAIAIHPKNKKLRDFIGQFAIIPFINKQIPIIADEYADPEKGSGAVKITPAHDFNDFLVGKRHNLDFVNIFDKNARLNKNATNEFVGLDRNTARKKILHSLNDQGLIEKEINQKMTIPVGDRSGAVIEPFMTLQWFVDSKKLCVDVEKIIKKNELVFFPSSWMKTFKHWIKNIEPWCISRQIWWGHRIPVWYSNKGFKVAALNEKNAKEILKEKRPNESISHQDEDVLDTWFSSALWPFSTLGWPNKNEILKKYYPSNVLVTGFDIIFFWVARMVMMGSYFMKKVPFKNVYIHPLVRDEKGNKMSKSKGNVIDPIDLIDIYGADALRFTLVNLSTQGRDIKLSNKLVENSRNFITKLWNAARFSQFHKFSKINKHSLKENKLIINDWILESLNQTQVNVIKYLKNYKFNLLIKELYHFIWNDFCDIYLELSKIYLKERKNFDEISYNYNFIFDNILNLINPIVPFVSEKISKELGYTKNSLFNKKFVPVGLKLVKKSKVTEFKKIIQLLRDLRSNTEGKKQKLSLVIVSSEKVQWIESNRGLIISFFNLDSLDYDAKTKKNIDFLSSGTKFIIDFQNDLETKNLEKAKKIKFYEEEIKFFKNKLSNKKFITKAPVKIVNENKSKLKEAEENLILLKK